jgi:hypothetical protein
MSRGMRWTSVRRLWRSTDEFFSCFILLIQLGLLFAVHDTRDRILLEGEDQEGGEEWGDGEEEVFGLGLDDDSGDDSEEG